MSQQESNNGFNDMTAGLSTLNERFEDIFWVVLTFFFFNVVDPFSHSLVKSLILGVFSKLGYFGFNRHYFKSIFEQITLNWLPRGFLHRSRDRLNKNHELDPTAYRPPNKLFHFFFA